MESKPNFTVKGSVSISNSDKVVRFQECAYYKKYENSEAFTLNKTFYNDFAVMERKFNCSGICKLKPYYLYSDIRRGSPKISCGHKLFVYMDSQGYLIGATGLGGAISLIVIIMLICLINRSIRREEAREGFHEFNS